MNIDFPWHYDSRGRTAVTNYNDHIRDMIIQFLFTDRGERVNRPDFGAGVKHMIFEGNRPEFATVQKKFIADDLKTCLRDVVDVKELKVTSREASLDIKLRYFVPQGDQSEIETFEGSIEL